MKIKLLSISFFVIITLSLMSVSNPNLEDENKSPDKFWGSQQTVVEECSFGPTGYFCCTTTTTTTYFVFWMPVSYDYNVEVDCI